jgi:hypothetical protein
MAHPDGVATLIILDYLPGWHVIPVNIVQTMPKAGCSFMAQLSCHYPLATDINKGFLLGKVNWMNHNEPGSTDRHKYVSSHRYNWILISDDLEFVRYEVLPDIRSKRLTGLAEIQLRNAG